MSAPASAPKTAGRIRHCTALAALVLLATTACAGAQEPTKDGGAANSSAGSAGNDDASGQGKKADQALEYRKCLRDQGLDVPEPKPGEDGRGLTIGGDGSKEKMEKAFKACRSKSGSPAGGSGQMSQADKDKAIKYAGCMRKNGVDMPDPKFDGSMQKAMPMPKPGPEKDKLDKAMKACSGEM